VHINKTIKTPNGDMQVNCTFTAEEAEVIFTVGLTEMLRVGAIPFSLINQMEMSKFAPGGSA
jgi:hypothetical protein